MVYSAVVFVRQHVIQFKPSPEDEVHDIIMKSLLKSCDIELLPLYQRKQVLECVVPFIIAITY